MERSTNKPVRIAVIGINNQGEDHIQAILKTKGAVLAAIVDENTNLLQSRLKKGDFQQQVKAFDDWEETIKDPDIDALTVALPHHIHPKVVKMAAQRGMHLLKEKPLGRNLEEANEMVAQARQGKIVLHTGVQRRHHQTYQKLKRILDGQVILSAHLQMQVIDQKNRPGEKHSTTWRDDAKKAGGGVLIDLGYHGIDLLHYLLGPMEPLSLNAWSEGRPTRIKSIEKNARIFARAGQVPVHMFFGRGIQKQENAVIETKRGIYSANRSRIYFEPLEGEREMLLEADQSWESTMIQQLQSFVSSINDDASSSNDTPEQTATIRFIEKCYASRHSEGLVGPKT